MRVCAAAGCESFITSTGCVDVWDPKVLRCAAGGHFHVPIYYNLSWEEINKLIANKRIFLADTNTSGMWKVVITSETRCTLIFSIRTSHLGAEAERSFFRYFSLKSSLIRN